MYFAKGTQKYPTQSSTGFAVTDSECLSLDGRQHGQFPFSKLPNEIQLNVISFLRYDAVLAVRLVSRHFRELITTADVTAHYEAEKPLLLIDETNKRLALDYPFCPSQTVYQTCRCPSSHSEILKRSHEPLPCYTCRRWLPAASFTKYMSRDFRALGQQGASGRICLSCGVRSCYYARGSRVGPKVVCMKCGQFFDFYYLSLGPLERRARLCGVCAPDDDLEHAEIWEFRHRPMRKYLEGMMKGKEYRDKKGERIRRERGIVLVEEKESKDGDDGTADPDRAVDALLTYRYGLGELYRLSRRSPDVQTMRERPMSHFDARKHGISRLGTMLETFSISWRQRLGLFIRNLS